MGTVSKRVLEQDFNGWNHLHEQVSDVQAKQIQSLLSQAKLLEEQAVELAVL
jgi:hypothetical protein